MIGKIHKAKMLTKVFIAFATFIPEHIAINKKIAMHSNTIIYLIFSS